MHSALLHPQHCAAALGQEVHGVQEETLTWVVEDLELFVSRAAVAPERLGMNQSFNQSAQYIDEGLARKVLVLCNRIQNSGLAVRVLALLERTLKRLATPPASMPRRTTASGTRVPLPSTYLAAISACCGALPQHACSASISAARCQHHCASVIKLSCQCWHWPCASCALCIKLHPLMLPASGRVLCRREG
jgi:hypothetical protein